MSLHRLTFVTIGVPNLEQTAAYYQDFGLTPIAGEPSGPLRFATRDGGEQLRLVRSDRRRLVTLGVGVDDQDDLDRVRTNLAGLGVPVTMSDGVVTATDPGSEVTVEVSISSRLLIPPVPAQPMNGPGRFDRVNQRAPGIQRDDRVRPRKLGHAVLGTTDQEASERFFIEGVGFKVSDLVRDRAAFIRCSTDHHNLLLQRAPISFLHHTSWQVDDVDEIGRGATHMLEADPSRHVWGLGRHHIGSNFFWYLRDPAGNFSEYYSDIDCIVDDQLWKPEVWEGMRALYNWGPPPPASFITPDDLAAVMAGAHEVN